MLVKFESHVLLERDRDLSAHEFSKPSPKGMIAFNYKLKRPGMRVPSHNFPAHPIRHLHQFKHAEQAIFHESDLHCFRLTYGIRVLTSEGVLYFKSGYISIINI